MQTKSNVRSFLGFVGIVSFFLSLFFLFALLIVQPLDLPLLSRFRWMHSVTAIWLVLSLGCSAILIPTFYLSGKTKDAEPVGDNQSCREQSHPHKTYEASRDAVWVCNYNASGLGRRLDAMQDLQITLEVIKRYERGESIASTEMPKSFILRGKRVSTDIMICAFLFVSEDVVEVLRRFDLGKDSLVELEAIYRGREKKPLSKVFFILTQQNRKEAFSAIDCDQSWIRKMSRICPQWGMFVEDAPDNAFAVTENALDGPDIWRDPAVPQQIFFSNQLKMALDAQGIGSKLGLKRCRVVQSAI
nr:hypothetical protein [uncultured Roseovarius sp.]